MIFTLTHQFQPFFNVSLRTFCVCLKSLEKNFAQILIGKVRECGLTGGLISGSAHLGNRRRVSRYTRTKSGLHSHGKRPTLTHEKRPMLTQVYCLL